MFELLKRIGNSFNYLFEQWLFVVLIAFMGAGWCLAPYLDVDVGRKLVPPLFAFMTWFTSLRCSWHEFVRVVLHPGAVVLVLALLHLGVPAAGLLFGKLFYGAHPELITGFVLCGAIPIGVTSAVWTGILGGDVALSLAAVTVDTLLSPIVTPAVIFLFLGSSVKFDALAMIADLLKMIVLPAAVGLTIHDLCKTNPYDSLKPYVGPFSNLSLGLVVGINMATARQTILDLEVGLGLLLVFVVAFVGFGYFLGYIGSRCAGYDEQKSTAVMYSVGLRNLSAGLVIALGHFPTLTIVPVVMSMLFQQPMAALGRRFITPEKQKVEAS